MCRHCTVEQNPLCVIHRRSRDQTAICRLQRLKMVQLVFFIIHGVVNLWPGVKLPTFLTYHIVPPAAVSSSPRQNSSWRASVLIQSPAGVPACPLGSTWHAFRTGLQASILQVTGELRAVYHCYLIRHVFSFYRHSQYFLIPPPRIRRCVTNVSCKCSSSVN